MWNGEEFSNRLVQACKHSHQLTRDFDYQLEIHKKNWLGAGSFGTVYYGIYNQKPVAVKVLHSKVEAENDFIKEVKMLK